MVNRMANYSAKWSRLLLALTVLVSCLGCDQATKYIAARALRGLPPQIYVSGVVRIEYAMNPGGFLSLGSVLPPKLRFWTFIALNALFLSAAALFLVGRWSMPRARFLAIALMLAGGLGNLIDRALQGGLVTDFVSLGIGPVRTGIFNVADVALMAGAVAMVFMFRDAEASTPST
jgi:signal peptidase II